MKNFNMILCGIGGQGLVLTSEIIASVFLDMGYDVKSTNIVGLGQRGGSVITHIRIGKKVQSPLIKKKGADMILAFEKYEALRWSSFLNDYGRLVINDLSVKPNTIVTGFEEDIDVDFLIANSKNDVIEIQANKSLIKNNIDARSTNMFMTGVFSALLKMDNEIWEQWIRKKIKQKYFKSNINAFNLGRKFINEKFKGGYFEIERESSINNRWKSRNWKSNCS